MNVPKIRFKEFSDEWRKINLKDISIINPKNEQLPNEFIYIDLESVNKGILSQEKIISKTDAPSRAQRTVKKNDILFQMVRPYQQNNYFIKEIKEIPYVASTGYALIRTSEDPYFIYSILHKKDFLDRVIDRCTGTSFPAINANDLGDININIPSIQEQNKVSSFLSLLDKKIELQTKKIEDLKLFKKGLNYKIFSNCNDECNLNDILIEYNKKTKVNNEYEVLSSTANGIYLQNEYFNKQAASQDTTGYKILPRGYVTYRSMSDTGDFHFNEQCIVDYGIVSPAYPVFKIDETKVNKSYLLYYMNENKDFINRILSTKEGGTRFALSYSKLLSLKVKLPSINEQNRYALLIFKVNKKIEYENKRLFQLNVLKKGLMQNMFV